MKSGFVNVAAVLGSVVMCAASALGQGFSVPLNFGVTNGIVDEFGVLLEGTAGAPGDLIQILEARQGKFPPTLDGMPHADNPVIATAFIGQGTDPSAGSLGKAAGALTTLADRSSPNNTNTIFARVFNAPSIEEASFYQDSSLYDVPVFGSKYGVFFIDVQATTTEINTNDVDKDGLSASWEKSLGTDPGEPDTDGDGMMDGHEILAGTDALDDTSILTLVELIPASGGDMEVMWDAVPGVTYQLEYTVTSALEEEEFYFQPINPQVTATGPTASTIITNGAVPSIGTSFRVRVVVP